MVPFPGGGIETTNSVKGNLNNAFAFAGKLRQNILEAMFFAVFFRKPKLQLSISMLVQMLNIMKMTVLISSLTGLCCWPDHTAAGVPAEGRYTCMGWRLILKKINKSCSKPTLVAGAILHQQFKWG